MVWAGECSMVLQHCQMIFFTCFLKMERLRFTFQLNFRISSLIIFPQNYESVCIHGLAKQLANRRAYPMISLYIYPEKRLLESLKRNYGSYLKVKKTVS